MSFRLSSVGRFGSSKDIYRLFMDEPNGRSCLHGGQFMEWCYYLWTLLLLLLDKLWDQSCVVGSGRAFWTSWRWIIFRFSISFVLQKPNFLSRRKEDQWFSSSLKCIPQCFCFSFHASNLPTKTFSLYIVES